MVNSGKLFRAAVYDETLALPEAVKMKEVWQHVLAELEANFLPNEELLHAVPVTNSNSHLATSGLMGLTYAKKTLAKLRHRFCQSAGQSRAAVHQSAADFCGGARLFRRRPIFYVSLSVHHEHLL